VGDAASQVKATTVGGVVAGLRGAKAVASLILGRKEEAKRELEKLRCELNLHLLLRKILNRFGEEDYRRLLLLLRRDNGLASFISRYTRDDLASFFFKLIFRYPRLAWVGLRALLPPKWGHKHFFLIRKAGSKKSGDKK
jgi:flavin-dependent dehydrogenase